MNDDIPETEMRDERTRDLDILTTPQLVGLLAAAHRRSVDAVAERSAEIAAVVEHIAARLRAGGRLHYVGAGTSGRLAVLDAAEMTPTFGTPPEMVCAHIAGGAQALRRAVEGAEDDRVAGRDEMEGHCTAVDAVIGISASGTAPFVLAALERAKQAGAFVAAIVNACGSPLERLADAAIVVRTGAEPIAGSTRMKAGTAQKIVLNTISTAVMIALGHVYDNAMVDVVATNAKLRARALRLVQALTGTGAADAAVLLEAAGGSVKVAVLMGKRNLDAASSSELLAQHDGRLRRALE